MQIEGGGKYRLGARLGAGGMAEVYRGQITGAEGFSRPVAIKRVLPHVSADKLFAKMFINEARISSMLSHPNVVSVIDFDRDAEGCLFLVMELIEGRDLSDVLAEGGLSFPVVIHVIVETLRGLGYAHDLVHEGKHLGIVHRDVSPHNVLVSWEGAVKVSDFGIAKAAAASDATRSGMLKGKVAYMSPEQANGQQLDGRSDLFAVGVMLYLMLTSQAPFTGGSVGEVIAQILNRPVPPPRSLRPDVPEELDAITMRLLEKQRDRRYPSARDVIDALLGCQEASPRGADLLAQVMCERFPANAPVRPTPASSAATMQQVGPSKPRIAPAKHESPAPPALGGTLPLPDSVAVAVSTNASAGPASASALPPGAGSTPAVEAFAPARAARTAAERPGAKRRQKASRLAYALALVAAVAVLAGVGLAIKRTGDASSLDGAIGEPTGDEASESRADLEAARAAASAGEAAASAPGTLADGGAGATLTGDAGGPGAGQEKRESKSSGSRRPEPAARKRPPRADWDIEIGKRSPDDLPVGESSP